MHPSSAGLAAGLGLALIAAPAAADSPTGQDRVALSSSRVDYWLDRPAGAWTGGMIVIRRGGTYWAYARFFEGKVCLSGHRRGDKVRMSGTFEYASPENVRVTWPVRNGMPKVKYTLGTVGDWRQVSRATFVTGTTTGDRLREVAKVTTPRSWRAACSWA